MPKMTSFRPHPSGVTVFSVGVALLLMLVLDPVAKMTQSPFLLFFGAVVVSAWYGGINSGFWATGLSALISNYFFLQPRYSFAVTLPNQVRLAVFILESILIITLCDSLRTTNQKLDHSLLQLKAGEASLRTANQRINEILESITDGFYTLNRQWQFVYINHQAETILQRSREELLGKSIWELFPTGRGSLFEQNFQRAIDEQIPIVFESCGLVHPERWFEIHINPLHDGLAIYFQDVTERKQAEVALRLSENRYRTLANAVPQLMWVNDPQGNVQLFNEPWQEYTGITNLELGGERWHENIHPEDLDSILAIRNQAIQAGQSYEIECRLKRFDQTYRWHLARVVPLKNDQGQVINWFGTATDIQDVKQTEAALRESEATAKARAEELETFMEAVPAAVWIAHDPHCHQMSANHRAYQLVELPPGSIATATPIDGVYPFPFKIQQDGQETPLDELPMQKAGRTGQEIEAEFDFVFENAQVRSIWGRAVPLRNEAGEVRGVIGAFLDITERKRAEEELREREQRFSTLFNGMEDWVIVYHLKEDNLPGKIIEVNEQACKKLGYSREEFLQMSVADIIGSSLLNSKTNTEPFLDQTHWVVESIHRTKAGDCIPCEVSATLFTLNGLLTVQFICRDITERQQIEVERERLLAGEQAAREAAETANRIKDEFLAVLSHELRSPLNPILGWTRLLQTRKLDEATTHRALEIIERNVKLQTQLIEELLDVSRILQGKMVLNTGPVNLVTTIEAAIETVQLAAEAKGIEIQTIFTSNEGYVAGDAGRLQQILWNLLSNAVKFTPSGGRVEVRLEQVGSQMQVQVQDTGRGINPAFLPYIFEYFRQEDGKTTRQFGGLGLGLAIVRHLSELHGGTVVAESAGEGLGATFTLKLPLMPVVPIVRKKKSIPLQSPDLSNLQVLVVDDEADMREFVLNVLQQYDVKVRVAASAAEALMLVEQFQPNVLVSDIGMPQVDGYMLIQQLRTLPPEQGGMIPAIALTAYASEFDRQQALRAGFQLHLSKPVEPEELIKAILSIVST